MKFKVPQDVQRADQIIGPLTWRQLITMGIGGGICYAIYVTLGKDYKMVVWLPPVAIVGGITAAISFLKIHNLTFEKFTLYFIEYFLLPKKRIWKKGQAEPFISYLQRKTKTIKPKKAKKKKQKKSLKELANILDTQGGSPLDSTPEVIEAIEAKRKKKAALKKLITHKN